MMNAKMTSRLGLVAFGVLTALACSIEQPSPKRPAAKKTTPPTPAATTVSKKTAAKPRVEGMKAGPYNLGPLKQLTVPTVEGIDGALPDRYTVQAAGDDATEGATVQVLLEGAVVAEIFPTPDGDKIYRTVSRHKHVVFPWNTVVGGRLGAHKHFDKMTCAPAPAPFAGEALCAAFAEARIAYLIKGWDGADVPGKEILADAKITGLLWTPREKDS